MSKKTLFLIFILVATVAILTYIAVLQSLQSTKKEDVATQSTTTQTIDPSSIPDTTLTASPSAALLRINDIQTVDVLIDTGENIITTAQIELSYDPEFVQVTRVAPGAFLEEPTVLLNENDTENGRIQMALGTLSPKKGQGVLATLTIIAKTPTKDPPDGGPTLLSFLPKTQVLGSSNANLETLIKEMTGASFIIISQ